MKQRTCVYPWNLTSNVCLILIPPILHDLHPPLTTMIVQLEMEHFPQKCPALLRIQCGHCDIPRKLGPRLSVSLIAVKTPPRLISGSTKNRYNVLISESWALAVKNLTIYLIVGSEICRQYSRNFTWGVKFRLAQFSEIIKHMLFCLVCRCDNLGLMELNRPTE